MKTKQLTVLIFALVLHLFFSNTKLMVDQWALNSELAPSWQIWTLKALFSLPYSIATAVMLDLYRKYALIAVLSVLDGFGVYLQYNLDQPHFLLLFSLYFGLYTCIIVLVYGLVLKARKSEPEQKIIKELKNEPKSEKNEAKRLEIAAQIKSLQARINPLKDEEKRAVLETEKNELKRMLNELN